MLTSCISSSVTLFVCKDYLADNKLEFIVKALCVGCLALVTTTIPLSYTKNFWYLLDRFLPHKMRKKFNRLSLSIICMGSILLFYLLIRFLGDTKDMSYEETGNKSLARTDSYVDEECSQIRFFHLSFDDTIECFKDITENDYDSIFGNPTFLWFKELHETYGVVITCYCYYEELDENPFDLEECTRKYQSEFKANSNWLRFGFHALNGNTIYDGKQEDIYSDYITTIKALIEIVGRESIDNIIRLQGFSGSYDDIKQIVNSDIEPVVGLLTADDNRTSYYLSAEESDYLYSHDYIYDTVMECLLVSTDLRVEYIDDIDKKIDEFSRASWNNQLGLLVVFSHEWALDLIVKNDIEAICRYAKDNGYCFEFFEEIMAKAR